MRRVRAPPARMVLRTGAVGLVDGPARGCPRPRPGAGRIGRRRLRRAVRRRPRRHCSRAPGVDAVVVCSPTSAHRADVELAGGRAAPTCSARSRSPRRSRTPRRWSTPRERAGVAAAPGLRVPVPAARAARQGGAGRRPARRRGRTGRGQPRAPPLPPHYPPWITTPSESGGGALIDHSVHLVDALRHLHGREVARVTAETGDAAVGRGRRGLRAAVARLRRWRGRQPRPELVGARRQPVGLRLLPAPRRHRGLGRPRRPRRSQCGWSAPERAAACGWPGSPTTPTRR